MVPNLAHASGRSREYYPPSDSDFYQKKFSYQLYFSFGTVKVRMTQYKPDLPMEDKNIQKVITWNVKENSYMWMDHKCSGGLVFEYLDESGEVVDSEIRAEDNKYLSQGSCTNPVAPSDFNEEKNQYKSDTFGGKDAPLTNPEKADGSGGKGSTGFEGEDDGTGSGGGDGSGSGSGGGSGSDSGECAACEILECPKWDEYMGKMDDIASKIPSPPNWDKVAETFRDKIAPQVKKDLEDTIGKAPDPGSPRAPRAPQVCRINLTMEE
ncbi:hypothetical protein [Peribacillus sp. TH24]|uniref:hypothetical protein n=1 Tax=Peribacillus sp. TH24 TaxID=2798483 RepID=UPI0019144EE2|nr:hypothetical protein [Peribacillus sp. TH24]MBK5447062.1 hypothetical protein [Peribacillus sp. TH24]